MAYQAKCSDLREGLHVILRSRHRRNIRNSPSETDEHGPANIKLTGIDIFTKKKYVVCSCVTNHAMEFLEVQHNQYELVSDVL